MSSPAHRIERDDELADWLRGNAERRGRVRVVAGGSRQHERAPAPADATRLDLSGLDRIVRLDPGDQTCTVMCGVRRERLDEALAEHDLELPCLGGGTVGGLFASDPFGPAAVPGHAPRSLLLGVEAVLASGQPFRSGARVVKSVAGFDVHKLFVGSHGRLFVVRQLHLRLKPRPRVRRWFANGPFAVDEALALVDALRQLACPPDVLTLRRDRDGGCTVAGRVAGRAVLVDRTLAAHRLREVDDAPRCELAPPAAAEESVCGAANPSRLRALLARLPDGAPAIWYGGGRFRVDVAAAAAGDELFRELTEIGVVARVRAAADPRRLDVGTARDPGAAHLADGLRRALDPDELLA